MPSIKVNGMHCVNCKSAVEKAVAAMPGVKNARVDLEKACVEWQEDALPPASVADIQKAIVKIGFQPE